MKILVTGILLALCFISRSQNLLKLDSIPIKPSSVTLSAFAPEELSDKMYKRLLDSFANFKKLTTFISPVPHFPLQFNKGESSYSGLYDSAYFFDRSYYLSYLNINTSWTIAGVPLQLNYKYSNWDQGANGIFFADFDREGYVKQLQKKLLDKMDPKKFLASIADPLSDVKRSAENALQREINQLKQTYQNSISQAIADLGDLQKLFTQDAAKLRQQFLSQDNLNKLHEQQLLIEQLQTRINVGEKIDTVHLNSLKKSIRQLEATKKLIEVVERHKKFWESSGLLAKMHEWDALKISSFEQLLHNPSKLGTLVRQHTDLNSLQRLFLKISKLKLGASSLSSSPLAVQNFLNNGGFGEFLTKGKSAMLYIGKSLEGSSVLDMPFTNTVFPSTTARGLQLSKKAISGGGSTFSISDFQQGVKTLGGLQDIAAFRHIVVAGFRKEFSIGSGGILTAELSRSLSSFKQKSSGNDASGGLLQLFATNNLSSNTSFQFNYRDDFPKFGLQYQFHVKKVALGYDNPGTPFLNTGSKEAGLSVRKYFLKKMLLFSARADLREYNYNTEANSKWRNMYAVFDLKWKMRKGQFLSFRYMPNQMLRINGLDRQKVMLFDQVSFEGNLVKKVGHSYYSNYMSVSYQRNKYNSNNTVTANNSLGLTVNQSLVIGKLLISSNTQASHSMHSTQLVYFNSSLNSDVGISYGLLEKITASTSISYNTIQEWYRQLGIRQNLSVRVAERFDMNLYIDARKNLKVYQPLIFGLIRGELGVHYTLK
ncbi:coiled-coil domain-containing protein [Flavisolibacter nicotianae]|uniref:hypothetical protein n=1 Tax=Flavisolibacter nicotianae TaxID=2364882 RepID=UPI000EB27ED8|nr:hypothetical protein [Flavisolibacter nicotianae]